MHIYRRTSGERCQQNPDPQAGNRSLPCKDRSKSASTPLRYGQLSQDNTQVCAGRPGMAPLKALTESLVARRRRSSPNGPHDRHELHLLYQLDSSAATATTTTTTRSTSNSTSNSTSDSTSNSTCHDGCYDSRHNYSSLLSELNIRIRDRNACRLIGAFHRRWRWGWRYGEQRGRQCSARRQN